MNIKSIQGDDNIQKLCNHAMRSTLLTLNSEGRMTAGEVEEFLNNHVAVFMTHDGGWFDWLKRTFGKEAQNAIVVCKTYTHID
jgi:hypothetical protein